MVDYHFFLCDLGEIVVVKFLAHSDLFFKARPGQASGC